MFVSRAMQSLPPECVCLVLYHLDGPDLRALYGCNVGHKLSVASFLRMAYVAFAKEENLPEEEAAKVDLKMVSAISIFTKHLRMMRWLCTSRLQCLKRLTLDVDCRDDDGLYIRITREDMACIGLLTALTRLESNGMSHGCDMTPSAPIALLTNLAHLRWHPLDWQWDTFTRQMDRMVALTHLEFHSNGQRIRPFKLPGPGSALRFLSLHGFTSEVSVEPAILPHVRTFHLHGREIHVLSSTLLLMMPGVTDVRLEMDDDLLYWNTPSPFPSGHAAIRSIVFKGNLNLGDVPRGVRSLTILGGRLWLSRFLITSFSHLKEVALKSGSIYLDANVVRFCNLVGIRLLHEYLV
jgi:hypothetical protein